MCLDQSTGHCTVTHINNRAASTAAKLTCEWYDGRTHWTGRKELGSEALYHEWLSRGQHSAASSSSPSAPQTSRRSRSAKRPRGVVEFLCPDNTCGMLFRAEESLFEHITRVHSTDVDAQLEPHTESHTATLANDVLSAVEQHSKMFAEDVKDDDSGQWTRGRRLQRKHPGNLCSLARARPAHLCSCTWCRGRMCG